MEKQAVKLCNEVSLTSRSEQVVEVRCNKDNALVSGEFVPKRLPGIKGVYAVRAQVIPDMDGHFLITLLNVNADPISLKKKKESVIYSQKMNRSRTPQQIQRRGK